MVGTSRFECPSSALRLSVLVHRTRCAVWVCLGLGAASHLSLTQLGGLEAEQQVAKPLTTQFVKRQPRLTKPLELKKRPQPRRRQIEREMVAVKAKVAGKEVAGTAPGIEVLGSLARPRTQTSRETALATRVLEPQAMAQAIEGAKESQYAVDMSLEMIDLEALDTGRYQAMVIVDPNDKRSIKGYVHLALAYPSVYHCALETRSIMVRGVARLVGKLNEWTDIRATLASRVAFDSPEFLRTPWTYVFNDAGMDPSRVEVESLGKYLLGGGFFFFEGHRAGAGQGEQALMRFVESALESQGYRQGADWEYELLANSHPILHCYYDLAGPPPGHEMCGRGLHRDDGSEPRARGIEIGGSLVALNTNQIYLVSWHVWGATSAVMTVPWDRDIDPTLVFRFGINTIIFALTQEGSITKRAMDSVED